MAAPRARAGPGLFDQKALAIVPDRCVPMGVLAQLARGSMPRLSNVVKLLEQRGSVQRAPDPSNGRYTHGGEFPTDEECDPWSWDRPAA